MHLCTLVFAVVIAQLTGCTETTGSTVPSYLSTTDKPCENQQPYCGQPAKISLNAVSF